MSGGATYANALNLAYWVYKIHPDLFAKLQKVAKQAQKIQDQRLAALGDDFTPDFQDITFDQGSVDISSELSPDLLALPEPNLTTVSFDESGLPQPTFSTSSSSSTLDTSSGWLSSALKSVGSFLTSQTGLTSLTNLGTAAFKANTPQAATVATQVARVQNGSNPAALTYAVNSAGQLVPVLQPAGTAGFALSPQALSSLIPTTWQPYVIPVAIGLLILSAMRSSSRS